MSKLTAEFLRFYDELIRPKLGTRRGLGVTKIETPLPARAMPYVGDAQDWRFYKNTPAAVEDLVEDSRVYLPSEAIAKLWGQPEEPGQ